MGISAKSLSELLCSKRVNIRHPSLRYFREVRKVMEDMLLQNRANKMAGMKGCMSLIRRKGHAVEFYINNGEEMRDRRVEAGESIFKKMKKVGKVLTDE